MIVTNKYNLPKSIVELAQNSQFRPTEKHYSVTTILSPSRSVLLTRRHFDEIEIDASETVNQILGTATHSLIEKMDKKVIDNNIAHKIKYPILIFYTSYST